MSLGGGAGGCNSVAKYRFKYIKKGIKGSADAPRVSEAIR